MSDILDEFYEIEYDPADYQEEILAANPHLRTQAAAPVVAAKNERPKNVFFGYELPDGVDLSDVDLERPPGIAGRIVDLMREGAYRRVTGGAYTLMALQVMAACAGKVRGYSRSKLSLVTITLGISAAGKEHPQDVAKNLLDDVGVIVSGDIRSDKDVLRAVIARDARCTYIIDEAQKLLTVDTKNETPATKNIQAVLLELVTSGNLKLSEMHKAEFSEKFRKQLSSLKKEIAQKTADIKACNPAYDSDAKEELEAEKIALEKEIEGVQRQIDTIEIGIKDPAVNLAAFSTPAKLAEFIDEMAIESGFMGRGLIADCGAYADKLNLALIRDDGTIAARLEMMHAGIVEDLKSVYEVSIAASAADANPEFVRGIFKAEPEAAELIEKVGLHFDDRDEYRNHPTMGPLLRRMYERMCSVSSILALDSIAYQGVAVIKKEHVLFAIAIILRSISMLESNLKINEGATSERMQDKMNSFEALLLRQLTHEFKLKSLVKNKATRGKAFTKIEEEARAAGQDAFTNTITKLIGQGVIVQSECGKKLKLA